MIDQLLTIDDMPAFTRLRMTAFGEAVIGIVSIRPLEHHWLLRLSTTGY